MRWIRPLLLALVLLAVQVAVSTSGSAILERQVTVGFINAVLVLSLHMFVARAGRVSLAQTGFMGIGAYTAILFTLPAQMKPVVVPNLYPALVGLAAPYAVALVLGGVAAALVAALAGRGLLRLRGLAFVAASAALLLLIYLVLANWSQVTNGPRAVFGIARLTTSWTTAASAMLVTLAAYWLKMRPNLTPYTAFVVSAFFAGVGGGLYAHFVTTFGADAFFVAQAFVVAAMLIVGGRNSVVGALAGVVVVSALLEGLRFVQSAGSFLRLFPGGIPYFAETGLALVVIAVLVLRPGGLLGSQDVVPPHGSTPAQASDS